MRLGQSNRGISRRKCQHPVSLIQWSGFSHNLDLKFGSVRSRSLVVCYKSKSLYSVCFCKSIIRTVKIHTKTGTIEGKQGNLGV